MRIALVNDSPMAMEALRRVVTSVPGYRIAWTAEDGEDAVRKCAGDVPDLLLMDLVMPRMDGVEATRRIMRESPCAILVVTASVGGRVARVFETLGHGALDAVDTPVIGGPGGDGAALLEKIAILGRLIARGRTDPPRPERRIPGTPAGVRPPLVVIGASTGGPSALAEVLRGLPPAFASPIVIVQHVDQYFASGLASWLGEQAGRHVTTATRGERPAPGRTYMAQTNDHLVLTRGVTFDYVAEPADYAYRPSIDVFFHSAVRHWHGPLVGVLLTGMGADGAAGLLELRRAGHPTIAQDEATSVVYGMPKAAAALGAAGDILPIREIASAITGAVISLTQE